jgi:hypothetical protein
MAVQSYQDKASVFNTACLAPFKKLVEIDSSMDNDLTRTLHLQITNKQGLFVI